MNHTDWEITCEDLLEASKVLLEKSGLARWDGSAFVPMYPGEDDSEFEKYWPVEFHPRFGRYMAWTLFSVGAENLAKAAFVCKGCRKPPRHKDLMWYIKKVCENASICDDDKIQLTKNYDILRKDVRNRDVHGYVSGVRRGDFPDVERKFVPAFNILVRAMKKDS